MDNNLATGLRVDALERRGRKLAGRGGPQRGSPMRVIFGIFPLLAIPVIIYNLMAFTHGGGADAAGVAISMARQISDPTLSGWKLPMAGGEWIITSGDLLVMLSMVFFFVEILKSGALTPADIARRVRFTNLELLRERLAKGRPDNTRCPALDRRMNWPN